MIVSRVTLPLVIAGYIAFFHPGLAFGARFYYETLPHLAILTAAGLDRLVGNDLRRRQTLGWAILILLITNLTTYVPVRLPYFRGYAGVAAGASSYALSGQLQNAVVLVPRGDLGLDTHLYYSFSSFNDPFLRRFPLFLRADPHLTTELLHQLFPGARIVKARFSGFSS